MPSGPNFTQWLYGGGPAQPNPTAVVGAMPPQPWARSVLDARRMMYDRIPGAQYPDGYLGTIVDRRGDRLLDSIKSRENQRSYQRGVHLGERIDPGDYLWPDELNPLRGLANESQGKKTGPLMEWFAPTPVMDDRRTPRGAQSIIVMDEHRSAQLAMLRPAWGLPPRRPMQPQG